MDFATLKLKPSPNQFLLCPDGFGNAKPHAASPVFDAPPSELAQKVIDVALAEPRTELAEGSAAELRFRLVQKSALFRFADDIDVQVVPQDGSKSALAVYSRSRVGYSDLGVNRKRVERWLGKLT